MKNIAVKVHNTNKTVQQAQVVTQDGQPTVIQAQKGVNYEFLDQATGRAPHHIITKREGNDLHVSFEENGKEADLIIEDFYSYPDSGLIGLAENGQYYNYIPDTGSVQDYVTQLNVGDVEGQALGGEGFPSPWWVAGNADMNVFPWLLGLGAIGAIAAIVSDNDNNNQVTPVPTTDKVVLNNLSVTNLSNSNNVEIKGNVTINGQNAPTGTTVDITLPNGKIVPATVGDNGQYSVILSDAESLNALKQGPKVTASKDNVTDIFNLTPAPKIDPVSKQDTTVTGTAEPNSEVTVKDKADKELGKVTTDANGKWSLPVPAGTELTSGEDLTATATKAGSNPSLRDDEIVTPPKPTINPVDETSPISGTAEPNQKVEVTLPNGTTVSTVSDDKGNWIVPNPGLNKGDKLTAEAVVSVDGKDIKSEPQPENVIDNTPPSEPQINPVKDGDTTVSGTAEPNSKVTLTDKDGNKIGETTADDKGNWTTTVTKPLKEGDEVKATATDASGNPSQPAEQLVVDTNAPNAPDIKPIADDNKPISGTAEPNSTVTVSFPDGTTATTKADDKGNWSVPNPGLNPGDKVTATATDPNGNESPKASGTVNDTTPPQQPVINGVKESDDTVTGTAEPNSTVTVTFPNDTTATTTADKDGKWSVPADPSVKDGGKITATAKDNAGNTSEKAEEPIVDDLAPPAPSVNPITEGNPITGTAQPNTTITIKDKDGKTIGTATTDDKGNWSVPAHPNVKTGDEVTATATDQAGNTSSPTKEVVIDDKAPSEPNINPIKDGDTTITGTAEPNSTVNIDTNGDGTPDKTVKADDKGNFTATVDTPLKAGDKVTATATDEAGNTSKPANEPVVDTTAPNQPDILPIDGDNKDAPIKGTAKPNSTVTVTFPDGKTATTKADDKGNWELPNPGLNTGDKVTATAKDESGKESSPAEAVVNGDITPPAKPSVNVSDDGKTITGKAEPNSTVEIDTNGDGQPDITTKADENGNYTAPLDKPLTNGETVTATAKDPAGNISAPATDTAPDTQPTETAINDKGDTVTVTGAKPGDTVTVKDPATGGTIGTGTVGNDGKATITLDKPITNGETVPVTVGTEDKPVTAPDASDTTSPDKPTTAPDMTPATDTGAKNDDNITNNDKPSFVVPAPQEGEMPVLLVDGKEVPADFDPNTNTLTPKQPIEPGKHKVTTAVKDPAGNVSDPSPELAIEIDKTAPNAPTTAPAVSDDVAPVTGAITEGTTTNDTQPNVAKPQVGEGETPVLFVDGVEVPAVENPDGTLSPATPLSEGPHNIAVGVKDKAGNVSDPSPVVNFVIDTTAPNAPTTVPDMTPATDTGAKNDDNITNNDKPSFVVPAPQEGETPVLLVDGKEVPADFDPNTNTLTPKQPIEPGKHKVTTAVKDPAGNVSDPSPELAIEIDKTAPNAPPAQLDPASDTGTKDDNTTKENKPVISGTGTAGDTIKVVTPKGEELTTTVKPNGTWSVTPTQALDEGNNTIKVTATDPAGNPSPETPVTVKVDSITPTVVLSYNDIVSTNKSDDATIEVGVEQTITFTFSEAIKDGSFTADDIKITGGTVGTVIKVSDTVYTATVTPNNVGRMYIAVEDGAFTDLAGNANKDGYNSGTAEVAEDNNALQFKVEEPTTHLSIADATIVEGTLSDTVTTDTTMKFTVTRTGDTSVVSSATWTVKHGTTTAEDFVGNLTGTVNFGAGETSKEISVTVKADSTVEKDETFNVTLSAPSSGTDITKAAAIGKILNDDQLILDIDNAKDTFGNQVTPNIGNDTDNYLSTTATNGVVTVNVTNLPTGVAWQYNLGDGTGWQTGTGSSFTFTDNNDNWEGKLHNVQARIAPTETGYTPSSTVGSLAVTVDNKARIPTATAYDTNTKALTGYVEAEAFVYNDQNQNGKWDNGEEFTIAGDDGKFSLNLTNGLQDFRDGSVESDKIQGRLSTVDKAGNTLTADEQGRLYYFNALNAYDYLEGANRSGGLVARVHDLSNSSDIVLVSGGIFTGTYNFNAGDDSLYVTGSGLSVGVHVNMGEGQDYMYLNKGMDNGTTIDMGTGNDILEFTTGSYIGYNASVNLGDGDDKLVAGNSGDLLSGNAGNSLDGSTGIDTLQFTGTGATQSLAKISGIEVYNLTGSGDNQLTISSLTDFNRNATTFTDDNGKDHTALMIQGNQGDKVDWFGATAPTGSESFNGVSYDIYTDGQGNQLLVQTGVQVI